jgi:hypothetical protein
MQRIIGSAVAGLSTENGAGYRYPLTSAPVFLTDMHRFHPVVRHRDLPHLKGILDAQVVKPAEALYADLRPRAAL